MGDGFIDGHGYINIAMELIVGSLGLLLQIMIEMVMLIDVLFVGLTSHGSYNDIKYILIDVDDSMIMFPYILH